MLAIAAAMLLGAAPDQAAPVYDVVIRGGRVLDGGGNPWVRADVAVKDGRIIRVGWVEGKGRDEIDARGRYVSPGFIDVMDQSGEALLEHGGADNKLLMGVTTLISGEGGTPVPAAGIADFFARLERQGIAVNFGTFYGAGQARVAAMGDGAGRSTPAQRAAMERDVATAMRAGAFGIGTALIYPPDSFQSTEDLIALAKVAARCGGFYASHLRDESAQLLSGIDEAIRIGEASGAKVEIFHLKAAYRPLAGKLMPQAIARIAAARARGIDVAADMYPYVAGGTGVDATIPGHVFAQGQTKGWEQMRDPAARAKLKRDVAAGSQPGWSNLVEAAGGWNGVVLANASSATYDRFNGKTFAEIGRALGRDPADAAWDIALAALPRRAMALYFLMDERDVELALRQPWVSIGSDAAAAARLGQMDAVGLPHPRAYGTFPRVLGHYRRERRLFRLEEAVRKMTSWPAARMGLSDRGIIREGLRADLVIFDADTVADRATFAAPLLTPVGIGDVLVNGVVAVRGGKSTGSRSGAVLRHLCG